MTVIRISLQSTARTQFINIDALVREALAEIRLQSGVLTVFVPHTTAGLTINENADPDVCRDLVGIFDRLVPADHPSYRHAEGNSDAHAKATMVGSSVQIIVENGQMLLGTWQSVYFAEFDGPRTRSVWISG